MMSQWRKRHQIEIGLFLTLLVCYVYIFPRWADPNQNSRLDLVVAVVDQGTLRIDDYVDNTVDYAKFEGHYYSDKAPGVAFAGIPVYAALRAILSLPVMDRLMVYLSNNEVLAATLREGGTGLLQQKVCFAMAQVAVTLATASLPSALLGVLFYRILAEFTTDERHRLLLTLIYALATPAFAYAGAFYGHQLCAACLFSAFYLVFAKRRETISTRRLLTIGFALGYAVITEYPAVIIAGILFLYTLCYLADRRRVGWLVVGGIPPGALAAAYNYAIYQTPLPVGYKYSELWAEQHYTGFMSLTFPRWEAIWGLTFGPFRGLFFLSPVLLLAIPGFVAWWQSREHRSEFAVAVSSVLGFFLFNSSSIMWWGGFSIGPRYLVPILHFLGLPIIFFLRRWSLQRWSKALLWVLGLWSLVAVWGLTLAEQAYPSERWRVPLVDYAWPNWLRGNIARNAGMFLGLPGISSLIPLLAGVFVALYLLLHFPSSDQSIEPRKQTG
jgi:hypothetical protein